MGSRPNTRHLPLRPALAALTVESLFVGKKIADESAARCCLAGLWLLHNFLDESHAVSQEIETASGSYWHGLMHRREPDYENAKYWFRRVGRHPIFEPLALAARKLAGGSKGQPSTPVEFLLKQDSWNPDRFIDLCEALAQKRPADPLLELTARSIATLEWGLLFEYCSRAALGGVNLKSPLPR